MPVERNGRRCISVYSWEIPDAWDADHVAHVVMIFDEGNTLTSHEYAVPFRPFHYEELVDRAKAAGFINFSTDDTPDFDRYAIVAT